MVTRIGWKQGRMVLLAAAIVGCAAALLSYPEAAAGGISRGLSICSTVIIPSLFPFLVLIGFMTRVGLTNAIGRRLERPTRWLFGLPGCAASVILISAIGGYPAGGTMIGDLVRARALSREEGQRMMCFCVNAGTGFVISAVGAGLTGSTALGWIIYAANVLSSWLIGIAVAPRASRHAPKIQLPIRQSSPLPAPAALVEAVTSSCRSLLFMCGFVVLFSAVLSLYDVLGGTGVLSTLLPCLLEVSCGCVAVAKNGVAAPFLLGFAVGFGGLSVHCQLACTLHGTGVLTPSFFLYRLLHGTLTACGTLLLLRLFPITLPVFSGASSAILTPFSGSAGMSAALLLLGGVWMLCIGSRRRV